MQCSPPDWALQAAHESLKQECCWEGWEDEEFCKAYEALEEHEEQYQRWMEIDNIFWLQVKTERQEDDELFKKVDEQEREEAWLIMQYWQEMDRREMRRQHSMLKEKRKDDDDDDEEEERKRMES